MVGNQNNNGPFENQNMDMQIFFGELFGWNGPWFHVFRNVGWFCGFNGAYLGLFAFLPETLGRLAWTHGLLPLVAQLNVVDILAQWTDLGQMIERARMLALRRGDALRSEEGV